MQNKLVINKDGKSIECEVLFTFTCDDNGKGYLGYTDHTLDEDGNEQIFTASYYPDKGYDVLEPVITKWELDMVNDVIERIRKAC